MSLELGWAVGKTDLEELRSDRWGVDPSSPRRGPTRQAVVAAPAEIRSVTTDRFSGAHVIQSPDNHARSHSRELDLALGTADDFSNLNVLLQNLRCWKKKLFSFPTQQILARSVKKRRSYRSSKSSGLQTNLSPSLREKIRFDGTSGLIFHPDNGSFAYTLAHGMRHVTDRHWVSVTEYHWRMHGGAKTRRFASFRLAVLTSTGPLFWFVWTEHERTHALKDHDWNDFVKLLQWANFHGIRCSCCPIRIRTQGWVVVNFGVVVLGSKTHGLVGPTIATQVPVSPAQPVAWLSKILQRRSSVLAKKSSVTPRSASRDRPRHTVCMEEMAETSTPFRKHARASIRLSRICWNLVPRLIDTRRIRKSHPPEGSSTRKSKKIPPLACEVQNTSSRGPILTKRTLAERTRSALQALQTAWTCVYCQLSEQLLRNTTFFVPSRSTRCYAGGATKGKGSWRHRSRSLLACCIESYHMSRVGFYGEDQSEALKRHVVLSHTTCDRSHAFGWPLTFRYQVHQTRDLLT